MERPQGEVEGLGLRVGELALCGDEGREGECAGCEACEEGRWAARSKTRSCCCVRCRHVERARGASELACVERTGEAPLGSEKRGELSKSAS